MNINLKAIEWEHNKDSTKYLTKLRFTLNDGYTSPIFGTRDQEDDSEMERFDLRKNQLIRSAKVWHNNSNQLFGLEFRDQY
jgi:hypothetical protein